VVSAVGLWVVAQAGLALGAPSASPHADPVAVEDVAFLRAPFDGAHMPASLFDHGAEGGQLAFDGRVVYGTPGHRGYDFAMPEGTPLLAAADGVVTAAGDLGPVRCWGRVRVERSLEVRLLHEVAPDGNAYATVYMHLSEVSVAAGQRVRAGERLGSSGNTGCSRGPHLHFQVDLVTDLEQARRGGSGGYPVDPYGWAGAGPDPRIAAGEPGSRWLWLDGHAPALRRAGRRAQGSGVVGLAGAVGTDLLDPWGESVAVTVREDAPGPVSLLGYRLENGAGAVASLPDVSVAPGVGLTVWVQRPGPPGPGELRLGRGDELIDDRGDCVHLVDPSGRPVAWVPFGTADSQRRCRRAPATVADPEGTE
jgi:hypothetical protein